MFDQVSFFQGALVGFIFGFAFFIVRLQQEKEPKELSSTQLHAIWLDAWYTIIKTILEDDYNDKAKEYAKRKAKSSFIIWYRSLSE